MPSIRKANLSGGFVISGEGVEFAPSPRRLAIDVDRAAAAGLLAITIAVGAWIARPVDHTGGRSRVALFEADLRFPRVRLEAAHQVADRVPPPSKQARERRVRRPAPRRSQVRRPAKRAVNDRPVPTPVPSAPPVRRRPTEPAGPGEFF